MVTSFEWLMNVFIYKWWFIACDKGCMEHWVYNLLWSVICWLICWIEVDIYHDGRWVKCANVVVLCDDIMRDCHCIAFHTTCMLCISRRIVNREGLTIVGRVGLTLKCREGHFRITSHHMGQRYQRLRAHVGDCITIALHWELHQSIAWLLSSIIGWTLMVMMK